MNEQLKVRGCRKKQMQSAKDRERERERERQFHQLKKRGDGGNIVNGCSMGVEVQRKGRKKY